MWEEIVKFLNKLLEVSPYLAVMVLYGVLLMLLYGKMIKAHKELTETTINQLNKNTSVLLKELTSAYKNKG